MRQTFVLKRRWGWFPKIVLCENLLRLSLMAAGDRVGLDVPKLSRMA